MSNKSKKNKKSKNTKVRKRQERLNRTKEAWAELFELLWAESDIELEPDEEIKQCKRPYPKYWFVTSNGRLFSIWNKRIEQLKVDLNMCGKKRDQLVWRYTYNEKKHVPVDKLVFDHFGKKQWDGKTELHHKIAMKQWSEEDVFEASKIDNIQALPKKIHTFATELDNNTDWEMFMKLLKKTDGDVLEVDLEYFLSNFEFPEGVVFYFPVKDEYGHTGWEAIRDTKATKIERID